MCLEYCEYISVQQFHCYSQLHWHNPVMKIIILKTLTLINSSFSHSSSIRASHFFGAVIFSCTSDGGSW